MAIDRDDDDFKPNGGSSSGEGDSQPNGGSSGSESHGNASDSEDSQPVRSAKRVKLSVVTAAKKSTPPPRTCDNEYCQAPIPKRSRKGPDGSSLCYPCGKAYKDALDAAGQNEVKDDRWKQRSTRVTEGKKKAKASASFATAPAPDASSGTTGEKRKKTIAKATKYDHTCKDCGSHQSQDSSWVDNLCYHCRLWRNAYANRPEQAPQRLHNSSILSLEHHSYTMLSDLAWSSFRRFNPDYDPFVEYISPPIAQETYWDHSLMGLRAMARNRGISGQPVQSGASARIIEWLQIADARNGILPRPRPGGAAKYHEMHVKDLEALASKRGFHGLKNRPPRTAESYIKFLTNQDVGADDAVFHQEMEEADLQTIVAMLVDDLAESLGFTETAGDHVKKATREAAQEAALAMNNRSHNRGIFGSNGDLLSLEATLMRNHWPTATSSQGFLCGPRAAAHSFVDTYRSLRREDATLPHLPEGFNAEEIMHRMMEMLFSDYRRDAPIAPEALGTPTPAYASLIMERIGHLYQNDRQLYNYYYQNYRYLNNLDVDQISAIFDLIQRGNLHPTINIDLGVGVVRGAHVRIAHPAAGEAQREEVAAYARRARTGTQGDVWLYNNVAQGAGQYNHFESFTQAGRLEMAFEWGLRTGDTEDMPKYRYNAQDKKAQATEMEKMKGQLRNLRRQIAHREKQLLKVCVRCSEMDNLDCSGGGMGTTCNRCKTDGTRCAWQILEQIPLPTFKASVEIKEEDLLEWDVELFQDQDLMDAAKTIEPTKEPDGPHYLLIGSARMSSNEGFLAMRQMLNNLVHSCTRYNNMIQSGVNSHVAEGRRPGGQAAQLPARRFHMAFARRGVLPAPWALGNLNDPYLIAWVNLWDEIMRPGNLNVPQEIIILTLGVAGHTVPVTGYGDRQTGWMHSILQRDAQNGTNVADSIHVLLVVEPHVINGGQTSIVPGQALQGWFQYRNKYLRKFKLLDLIDRWAVRQRVAQHQQLITSGALPAGTPAPILPNGPHEQAMDNVIDGSFHSGAWRQGGLGINTTPTDDEVHRRNKHRNAAINP